MTGCSSAPPTRHGIPEFWIIDPDIGQLVQLELASAGYAVAALLDRASTLTTPRFPAVSVPLGPVFKPYGE